MKCSFSCLSFLAFFANLVDAVVRDAVLRKVVGAYPLPDIHTGNALDLIEVNFGENNLFRNTKRIISVSVESVRINATEVFNTG